MAAESRSHIRMALESFLQRIIKPRVNQVILMENMNILSSRSLDASVPNACEAEIGILPGYHDTVAGNLTDKRRAISTRRTIVHDLDLHFPRSRVLPQNAIECFFEKHFAGIIQRYHY